MKPVGALLLVLTVVLVSACGTAPRRGPEDPAATRAYEARAAVLEGVDRWEISGRLAITDGEEGGSGSLVWTRRGDASELRFRGALGQGSWELEADSRGAVLMLGDGRTYSAGSVAELVGAHVGWQVPVGALAYWIRGLVAGSDWQSRRLDESGRLTRLEQADWDVEFGGYRELEPEALPTRLVARRDAYAVKLVIRDWRLGDAVALQ